MTLLAAWYRCGGGCGALVTSAGAWCLTCSVDDEPVVVDSPTTTRPAPVLRIVR